MRAESGRWAVLLILVLFGGPPWGIHAGLPIASELTVALWFLAFGIGIAGAAIGVEIASGTAADRNRRVTAVAE